MTTPNPTTAVEALAHLADNIEAFDKPAIANRIRQALQLHGGGESRSSLPPIALHDIAAERKRQTEVEGWSPDHDDEHEDGALALAAACYADPLRLHTKIVPTDFHFNGRAQAGDVEGWPVGPDVDVPILWPWQGKWWKPGDRRRELVKAGALIVAEIERLDRAPPYHQASSGGEAKPKSETTSNPILQGPTREELHQAFDEAASAWAKFPDERSLNDHIIDSIFALLNPTSPWRDMATAPLDGTEVDLVAYPLPASSLPIRITNCHFHCEEWLAWGDGGDDEPSWWTVAKPIGWMPLPAPPGGDSDGH